MDWMETLNPKTLSKLKLARRLRALPGVDLDDALDLVGLRRRPTPQARFIGGLGLVLGGVAAGVVLGMMLAPRSGRELRRGLSERGFAGLRSNGAEGGTAYTGSGRSQGAGTSA